MLLLFLQPLAIKALAVKVGSYTNNAYNHTQFQSNKQDNPVPTTENLFLEVEDEDEFSELENNSSESALICQSSSLPYSALFTQQVTITYSKDVSHACYNEPLYILWSVFRI